MFASILGLGGIVIIAGGGGECLFINTNNKTISGMLSIIITQTVPTKLSGVTFATADRIMLALGSELEFREFEKHQPD